MSIIENKELSSRINTSGRKSPVSAISQVKVCLSLYSKHKGRRGEGNCEQEFLKSARLVGAFAGHSEYLLP